MSAGWLPAAVWLCAVLCCAAPGLAETSPVAPALSAHDAEIGAFERAPLSLRSAIMIGETTSHAAAVAARFALEKGAPIYEVTTFGGDTLWRMTIDAGTGQLVGAPAPTPEAQLGDAELARLRWLQDTGSVPLRRAVSIAERQSGGKAISGITASRRGKLAYDLAVVKRGTIERVSIDPQSGRMLAIQPQPSAQS